MCYCDIPDRASFCASNNMEAQMMYFLSTNVSSTCFREDVKAAQVKVCGCTADR